MGKDTIRTRRGVYLDLNESPYQYVCKNGVTLKFQSPKKLNMFITFTTLAGAKIDRAFRIAGNVKENIDTKTMRTAQAAVEISIYKEGSEKWRVR